MIKKIETFWRLVATYLTLAGLVTFSLFIMEEAFQTAMFGTWPAQDAKEWRLVKKGIHTMEGINATLKFTNRWFGWIQPIAWMAYDAYGTSADYYTEALRAKVFAYCPECFIGETVTFSFTPGSYERTQKGLVYRAGTMRVVARQEIEETVQITAKIEHGLEVRYDPEATRRVDDPKPEPAAESGSF